MLYEKQPRVTVDLAPYMESLSLSRPGLVVFLESRGIKTAEALIIPGASRMLLEFPGTTYFDHADFDRQVDSTVGSVVIDVR